MPTHAEQKLLPYSQKQLFDLVANVEAYPEFLPWCLECRIKKQEDNILFADLVIGYKFIREKIVSKVTLDRPDHIRVEYLSGPMQYLSNEWSFVKQQDGQCLIDFYIDFEFRNPILQNLMGLFFNEAVRRMVQAFETRAQDLYTKTKRNDLFQEGT